MKKKLEAFNCNEDKVGWDGFPFDQEEADEVLKGYEAEIDTLTTSNHALQERIKELESKVIETERMAGELQDQVAYRDIRIEELKQTHNLEECPFRSENRELKNRINVLEASQPKWISVKERLPEESDENDFGDVLVITDDGICYTCGYDPKESERHKWFNGDIYLHNVTHWMPLPVPPKEEK